MTTPTVAAVTGWRPGGLLAAADRLAAAAATVVDDARAVRRHLGDAVDDAGGAWADAAADVAHREAGRGVALADALTTTATLLRSGARSVTHARDALLAAVERARAAGFGVGDDGVVVAPPAPDPPDDVPPAERLGWSIAPEQLERARLVEGQRASHQAEVVAALALAAAADEAAAGLLGRLDLPTTPASRAGALARRTDLDDGDVVAALGTVGGGVVVARALNDSRSLVTSGRRLHHLADLVRTGAPATDLEEARRAFAHGTSSNPVLKVVGRASMPLTVLSGGADAYTGGGYEGARGWATRGFGAAGAVGAVLVMTTPPLAVVGGVAVLAYGAWTAGNYVVDHWDQVDDAASAAGDWVLDEAADEAALAADAVAWADEQLDGTGALGVVGELF